MTIEYILIQTQAENDAAVLAEQIARMPGVMKAELVHGAYDVIAEVHEEAASTAQAIRNLDGVLRAISLPINRRATVAA